MPEEERIKLAQTINEADLTWTADPYINFDSGEGLMFAQTESHKEKKFADGTQEFADALTLAQKFLHTELKDLNIDDME